MIDSLLFLSDLNKCYSGPCDNGGSCVGNKNTLASASAIGQERTVKPSVSALLNIVIVINNENDLNCISFIRY